MGAAAKTAAPNMLEEALALARQDWAVFPLHGVRGDRCTCGAYPCGKVNKNAGKHPRNAHGLSEASTDEAKIREWWTRWPDANVGGATGAASGRDALDVDPRDGGEESLERLEGEHGRLPETPGSITGSLGHHVLFRHPSGRRVQSVNGKIGRGLDFKADGGYIVLPPSLHVSGRRYEWNAALHPDDTPLADLPSWIEAAVNGRSTFALARWMARYCPDADGPEDWIGEDGPGRRWQFPVCPWNPEHRDRSAYVVQLSSGAIVAGCHHNGCAGKSWRELRKMREPAGEDREHSKSRLGPEVLVPLSSVEPAYPEYDVDVLVRRTGLHMPWGPPGSYKTYFLLLLSLSMTQLEPGAAVLGVPEFILRRRWRRVLWLGDEESAGELRARAEIIARGHGLRPPEGDEILFADASGGDVLLNVRHIPELVEYANPDAVIVDPLANLTPSTDEGGSPVKVDLDNAHALRATCRPLRRLCKRRGLAVFLSHHPNASGERERGPTAYRGAADVVVKVALEGPLLVLDFGKNRDAARAKVHLEPIWAGYRDSTESPLKLSLHPSTAPTPPEETGLPDTAVKLLAAVRAAGPMLPRDLADAAPGVHRTTHTRNLHLLERRNLVEQLPDGRWIARARPAGGAEADQ